MRDYGGGPGVEASVMGKMTSWRTSGEVVGVGRRR